MTDLKSYKDWARMAFGLSEQSKEKDKDKSGEEGGLAHGNEISPESPERDIPEPETTRGPASPSSPGGTTGAVGAQTPTAAGQQQQVGPGDPEKEKEKEKELAKIDEPPLPKAKTTLGKYIVKHLSEATNEELAGEWTSKSGQWKVKILLQPPYGRGPARVEVWHNTPLAKTPDRSVVKPSVRAAKEFAKKYLKEDVSLKWKREADIPAMSHGGGIKVPRDRGKTYFSDTEPPEELVRIIDKNDKKVLAFAKKAFESKPYGVAMRLIEKYLERLGIPNSLSGDVAAILARAFKMDKPPVSTAYKKVQSKILPPGDPMRNVTPDYLQAL